jgi:hypothetical protein
MIPAKFRIAHDDYHARYVGRTKAGQQFFITTPFVPAYRCEGRNFVATFLFDREGHLVADRIDELGPRDDSGYPPGNIDASLVEEPQEAHVAALDIAEFCDIEIAPFEIQRFGLQFGLIPRLDDDGTEDGWIEMQPGNYMAFHEPWDGDYDT